MQSIEKRVIPQFATARKIMRGVTWDEVKLRDGNIYNICMVEGFHVVKYIINLIERGEEEWCDIPNKVILVKDRTVDPMSERLSIISDDRYIPSLISEYLVEGYGERNVARLIRRDQVIVVVRSDRPKPNFHNTPRPTNMRGGGPIVTVERFKEIVSELDNN